MKEIILNHPMVSHKISILRSKETNQRKEVQTSGLWNIVVKTPPGH